MVGVCVLVPVEVGSLSHTQSLLTCWSHQPACTGHPLPPLAEAGITVAPSVYMGSGHPNSGFLVVFLLWTAGQQRWCMWTGVVDETREAAPRIRSARPSGPGEIRVHLQRGGKSFGDFDQEGMI